MYGAQRKAAVYSIGYTGFEIFPYQALATVVALSLLLNDSLNYYYVIWLSVLSFHGKHNITRA